MSFRLPRLLTGELRVALLNGANIIAAFGSQMLIYGLLGPTRDVDVYFATIAIPQLVTAIVATTASGALLPRLARMPHAHQGFLAWWALGATVGATLVVTALLLGAVRLWAALLFPGFHGPYRLLCVELLVLQVGALPFIAASTVLGAWRQARGAFAQIETLNLAMTLLVVLGLIILLPRHGIVAAGWLFAARCVAQALFLVPGSIVRHSATLGLQKHRSLGELWRSAYPLLAGNVYFKTDLLVDRHLLSMAAPGGLSLFSLAQNIHGALATVIGQAWGSTAVPRLAATLQRGDRMGLLADYQRSLRRIALIALVALGLVLAGLGFGRDILVQLTHHRFSEGPASQLLYLVAGLSGILIFGSIGTLISGCFYAIGDTRTPTAVSVVTFTAFIALKIIVFQTSDLYAFCVLTSMYYFANAAILGTLLGRELSRAPSDDSR